MWIWTACSKVEEKLRFFKYARVESKHKNSIDIARIIDLMIV